MISASEFARLMLTGERAGGIDPANIPPWWVMVSAWMTAAFAEECLFRSYAIERLTDLFGNIWLASGVATVSFTLLHLVGWDWIHVLTLVFPASMMLTLVYVWRRSLLFVVVIHAILNVQLLLLPLLAPYL